MYLHRSSTEKHFYDVGIHTTFYPAEEDQSNVDVSTINLSRHTSQCTYDPPMGGGSQSMIEASDQVVP